MRQPGKAVYCLVFALAVWGAVVAGYAVTTTDFSRYQAVIDRKPFGEVAPIAVPGTTDVAAAAESFIKDYEMKGIIDDGEKLQVSVFSKKTGKYVTLDVGQEIYGMQLVSVNYDKEEAVLKIGTETTVIKLHPDSNKDNKGAAPAMAAAGGVPAFGMTQKNPAEGIAPSPFNVSDSGNRRPFFSDMKRRGVSPFQRMGTNTPFQSRSLESFFKPNTNMAKPFVSPFRPQSSPFKPVNTPVAGQEGGVMAPSQQPVAQPVVQPAVQTPQPLPDQGYQQIPAQPAVMPYTAPFDDGGIDESEE